MPDRSTLPRTWVELSRSALLNNLQAFSQYYGKRAKIAPVIKANAYGTSMAWAARTLRKQPIWGFCVAYGEEALLLRSLQPTSRILVLSAWQAGELSKLIRSDIDVVIGDSESIHVLARSARRLHHRARIHIKLDTGTTRIGIAVDEVPQMVSWLKRYRRELNVVGVFSHFADSESPSLTAARQQYANFLKASEPIEAPWRHMACTAASLRLPLRGTNLVRLGLGLYGLWPSIATRRDCRQLTLQPVLSWKTRLHQIKKVPGGTTVGYDRTYVTRRPTFIGLLPVGYSDGYDRRASNVGSVGVGERRVPVVGRVSMNLMAVDLGPHAHERPGDIVELIGRRVTADDAAAAWQTINYEVISRINPAIPRYEVP